MTTQPDREDNARNGRILRELRESRGLRRRQLAEQLNVSQRLIRAVENGERRLTNVVAYRAANYFRIPVTVLRPDLAPRPSTDDEDDEPELAAAS